MFFFKICIKNPFRKDKHRVYTFKKRSFEVHNLTKTTRPAKIATILIGIGAMILLAFTLISTSHGQTAPARISLIVVDKSDRIMTLYAGTKAVRTYRNIKLGDAPIGHKRFEGDERTPEGRYTINGRNPGSLFHRSLRISYPNAADRAYAQSKGRSPGGDIFIHGQPNGYAGPPIDRDWTDGCIAVSNDEIQEIWGLVKDGTVIVIRP
jgi:murein L,D-transpeptidase YafK